ncbi:MAG TPA: DUF533 domain-containing protein [Vicinamibacterales bacterium]|nr:DUF533 domain-containing protein [Vicinamibacterales bacterium]
MLNNPADMLGIVLRGTLGRTGRKRARKAGKFLTGNKGFLSASALISAAGVAWGIYDTLKNQNQGATAVPGGPAVPGAAVPPLPTAFQHALDPVVRIIQLAVSAAKADGTLSDSERALILQRAREAGLEAVVETELNHSRPLSEIVRGVSDPATRTELYTLAFTIVRADEAVSGSERIYLAQLAHQLGLDPAAVHALETDIANRIDSQAD